MAHTYIVTSSTAFDDQVTVVGSVDGVAVTVSCWLSHLQQLNQSGGPPAVKSYIASLMLAALPSAPAPVVLLPTGTFVL